MDRQATAELLVRLGKGLKGRLEAAYLSTLDFRNGHR